jgi:sarcosine oxidase subunit gamma
LILKENVNMSKPNLQVVPGFESMSESKPEARQHANRGVSFQPYAQSPLHAYGLAAKARTQDDSCGVWMNELPLLGYIVVRGDAQDPVFKQVILDVLGIELPVVPSTFVPFQHGFAVWQTPDEWMLVCTRAAHSTYFGELETALGKLHAQVVDNSGGLTTVYVSGARHVELLRHVSVYDFESLSAGRAVGTVCHRANIVALRHDSHGIFVILRRSFADYLWLLLSKAARPYGLGITALASRPSHPVLSLL